MARRRSGSIMIDVADIIEEIGDDDLREECESRGILPKSDGQTTDNSQQWHDLAHQLRDARSSRDGRHFEILICRMLALANAEPVPAAIRRLMDARK